MNKPQQIDNIDIRKYSSALKNRIVKTFIEYYIDLFNITKEDSDIDKKRKHILEESFFHLENLGALNNVRSFMNSIRDKSGLVNFNK